MGRTKSKAASAEKRSTKLSELLRVYQDLEKTLRELKAVAGSRAGLGSALKHIDVRGLIRQLSVSKRRLERKIGNTLLLEKAHIRRRIQSLLKTPTRQDG